MKAILHAGLRYAAAGAITLAAAGVAHAEFPNQPLRVIVPFGAGGATDVIARTVAQEMGTRLGQTVIVENRAGANGNIGAALAARSAPDGHTILMATSSHAINVTLYQNLDYSLTNDFAGLSNLASVPLVLVVNNDVPAKSVDELAAFVKAQGNKLSYASGGTGTAAHLTGVQFNTLADGKMIHVPYKGGAQAINDLIGGQVHLMFANLPEVLQQVNGGRLRALAITGDARHTALPDVPALAEMPAYADMQARSWFGLFVPAKTPADVVQKLSTTIEASVADPGVQQKLKALGADPIGNSYQAFQQYVSEDVPRWEALVRESGASVE